MLRWKRPATLQHRRYIKLLTSVSRRSGLRFLFSKPLHIFLPHYLRYQGCSANAKVLQRQHRWSSSDQPLSRSDAKSLAKTTSLHPSCSQVRISSAYFAWGRVIIYALFPYFSVLSVRPSDLFHIFNMCYLPDIAGQILFIAQHASFIAYFAWGRAIIYMII